MNWLPNKHKTKNFIKQIITQTTKNDQELVLIHQDLLKILASFQKTFPKMKGTVNNPQKISRASQKWKSKMNIRKSPR